ncbi:hypothetical protein J422_06987, partial [Methanocaldococcus villosus KIN24-T80]
KNRPGYLIRVIVDRDKAIETAKRLMKETGTLGVRIIDIKRIKANREVKEINYMGEKVKVKVSDIDGCIISKKPEYEDLKKIAKKYNKPLKDIYNEVKKIL